MFRKYVLVVIILILLLPPGFSHGDEDEVIETSRWGNPVFYIKMTGIFVLAISLFIATFGRKLATKYKIFFFLVIALPVVFSSLYLGSHTIYENLISETGGPVHWHADYQVIACGEKKELIDPEGIRNRIGTAEIHEHNDDRIHIEGTLKKVEDASLKNYFYSIGGELEQNHLIYQTEDGILDLENGDACPNGNPGILKVFVNGRRIDNFNEYVIYPDSRVPPGDCIIILFDETNSDTTNIICESWKVQGWNYDSFKRREINMGDMIWE
ncbi:hypothetical protein HYV49_04585 [Candidatus Pacearchaeota archaeon]|nr:hypothetical protein [Candidatus Pacearchaeota archaeon]